MTARLPESLRAELNRAFDRLAAGSIGTLEPTGGGCISETARVRTTRGESFFLKWSADPATAGMFTAEAHSLEALAATDTLRVPDVVDVGDAADAPPARPYPGSADSCRDAPSWLLLRWLDPGAATAHTWKELGSGLARLHAAAACDAPGWRSDNFIGSLFQANGAADDWPTFWRERRLRPQLDLALASGRFDRRERERFEALFAELDGILGPAAADGMSLLHGDLWSGNVHVLASAEPALIDPSCYCGHREVDLAMTQLFGGFDDAFYATYREAWPLAADHDRRMAVYQLYYLLVHVNLFGDAYRAGTLGALASAGF